METESRDLSYFTGWHEVRGIRTLWRPSCLLGVELIRATDSVTNVPTQQHEEWQLLVLEKGARRFQFRDTSQVMTTGSLVLIPSGEAHGSYPVENIPVTASLLLIHPSVLTAIAAEVWTKPRPAPPRSLITDAALAESVLRQHHALTAPQTSLEQQSLLRDLLYSVLQQSDRREKPASVTPTRKTIDRLQAFIRERYAQEISLEMLADLASLSPFHLSRAFRRETGVPPHAYQIQVRVHRARHLLAEGMPGGAVAQEIGFASQSHFTTHFKRLLGMTPGEYARLSRRSKNLVDSRLTLLTQSGHDRRI